MIDNSKNNIVAIIQARIGSTRLPGKVLMEIEGIPLLEIMMNRVSNSKLLDKIVIATSSLSNDDQIEIFCNKNGYKCFRGSEQDVLLRYYDCAKKYNADTIVRLTADCPLIDPIIIDKVIHLFLDKEVDYAANTVPPNSSTFPDGSDVEVFSFEALTKAQIEAKDPKDREHVTFYFWMYDNGFRTVLFNNEEKDFSDYRYTIDYPEDFEVVSFLIKRIFQDGIEGTVEEIISLLDSNPDIKNKNSKYYFGIGWEQ